MKTDLVLEDGILYRNDGSGCRTVFDFNSEYQDYYKPCLFTALSSEGGQFLLAGVDEEGQPHLFLSLMGSVWEERPLLSQNPLTMYRALHGEIFRILYEEENNQYYLICRNGEMAVMPDCPKCMRIFPSAGGPSSDGDKAPGVTPELEDAVLTPDSAILLTWKNGGQQRLPLESLRQFRVSVSFAARLLQQGAQLIDVREQSNHENEQTSGPVSSLYKTAVSIPLSELDEYLKTQNSGICMIFLCRTGRLADEAAEYARAHGFHKAFSIGGTEGWAHVE